MKKYIDMEIEVIVFQAQDIITNSINGGFAGSDHEDGFDNPNDTGNF